MEKLATGRMIKRMSDDDVGTVEALSTWLQLALVRTSPTKPKIQKVEGEDSSSTSSKVKEDEGSTEGPSMKELLEQANIMLKSLTTTAASSTATGSATDSREDVVDRLQSQLDQLKLKVF